MLLTSHISTLRYANVIHNEISLIVRAYEVVMYLKMLKKGRTFSCGVLCFRSVHWHYILQYLRSRVFQLEKLCVVWNAMQSLYMRLLRERVTVIISSSVCGGGNLAGSTFTPFQTVYNANRSRNGWSSQSVQNSESNHW